MKQSYDTISEKEFIMRDRLALDRTILANERTFLSYVRTTLALLVVGATLWHFTDDTLLRVFGALAIGAGGVILVIGIKRTLAMSEKIYGKKKRS